MEKILTDDEIEERCRAVLEEIGHAKASYIERHKFNGEKYRVTWDNYGGEEIKPVSAQKISQVLSDSDRFEPVADPGESVTIDWRTKW